MIKKYLTTPEEILALKNTDTEIHYGHDGEFIMKFVQGILCTFTKDGKLYAVNVDIHIFQKPFILVEEPVKEADENDIGKLCWFWDKSEEHKFPDILGSKNKRGYSTKESRLSFSHCRRLTPEEVAEITGYKVEG